MNKHIAVCNFRVAAVCSYLVLALITTSNDLVQTHSQSLTTDQMCPSAVTTALLKLPQLRSHCHFMCAQFIDSFVVQDLKVI